ncbi:MAG: hypothetical protein HY707_11540 [Ignavibacteriae bacterium]|nr:hypothetical protein [Ignavibacteriota bacterium]
MVKTHKNIGNLKRLRSLLVTIGCIIITNIAISNVDNMTQGKTGSSLLPNPPRPKTGSSLLPNPPRPKTGSSLLPNPPRP